MRILLDSCCDGDEGGGGYLNSGHDLNCYKFNKSLLKNLYLESPNYHKPGQLRKINGQPHIKSVFLAGSISNARDWQTSTAEILLPHFNVFNPRRSNYIRNEKNEREQIQWEYFYLNLADIVLFYFSNETVAPITLFEYGKYLEKIKYSYWRKLYVCLHPDYPRKNDAIIQTELENPELAKSISFDLEEICDTMIKNKDKI